MLFSAHPSQACRWRQRRRDNADQLAETARCCPACEWVFDRPPNTRPEYPNVSYCQPVSTSHVRLTVRQPWPIVTVDCRYGSPQPLSHQRPIINDDVTTPRRDEDAHSRLRAVHAPRLPPCAVLPRSAQVRVRAATMFVCLCRGVTNHQVADAVHSGACTSKEVATVCGAGSDCGRCRATVRTIIASSTHGRSAPERVGLRA